MLSYQDAIDADLQLLSALRRAADFLSIRRVFPVGNLTLAESPPPAGTSGNQGLAEGRATGTGGDNG